jgi:putative VirB-like lipoprotein
MRRIYLFLIVISLLLAGCSRQWEPSTVVYRSFSLQSIIERMNVPELESVSGDYGGAETKEDTVRRRREFTLIYRINEREGVRFDEGKFFHQLQAEVEKAIRESDVRIDGKGSSNDTFSLDYSEKDHRGWVDIVAARVEGNQFKLWGVMRENTENEKK